MAPAAILIPVEIRTSPTDALSDTAKSFSAWKCGRAPFEVPSPGDPDFQSTAPHWSYDRLLYGYLTPGLSFYLLFVLPPLSGCALPVERIYTPVPTKRLTSLPW